MKFLFKLFILLMVVSLTIATTACNGSGGGGVNDSNQSSLSSQKVINTYSLNGIPGVISDHNISVAMPLETDLTAMIATFTATGTNVSIANTVQTSGDTPNNFTNPVIYTVTAIDGSTATYTVTVTVSLKAPPVTPVFFTCVADGSDTCGCLVQNDGTSKPLMWYRYSSSSKFTFHDANVTFIQGFNSAGHCGHNDWRVPSIVTTSTIDQAGNADFGESGLSGDFANLTAYANQHGYTYKTNFVSWMNANGFGNIDSLGFYWSSNIDSSDHSRAWVTDMIQGKAITPQVTSSGTAHILPVRGG